MVRLRIIRIIRSSISKGIELTCIMLYLISQLGDSLIGVNRSLTYFLLETGDEKEDLEFGLCEWAREGQLVGFPIQAKCDADGGLRKETADENNPLGHLRHLKPQFCNRCLVGNLKSSEVASRSLYSS